MIQLQVLNKLLTDKSLNLVMNNGVTAQHFNEYPEEYEFITEHYRKYGNVPDDETMLGQFPEFELLNVTESDRYLIETLHEEYLYNQSVPILNKAAELLQANAQDAVEYLLPRIQQLMKECTYGGGVDIMSNTMERFNIMVEREGKEGLLGISSGLDELDELLGGWLPGEELVTIVGRVNQGKSWILLFFLAMAWSQGKSVLLYSGEMSTLHVGYRADTLLSHISNTGITRGTLNEVDKESYLKHLEDSEKFNTPFIVVTPKDLGGKRMNVPILESLIEKYNPDIIGIDQLSLMDDSRNNRDPLRVQLTHIAEDTFRLSEKTGKPILVDAQASRKSADKDTPEAPELTEIGESDGIGQYSSRVISIVQAPSGLKISIKKNRYGANNKSLSYCWDIDKGRFDYLPSSREEDISGPTQTPSERNLQVRNRRGTKQQREQFSDGSEVF